MLKHIRKFLDTPINKYVFWFTMIGLAWLVLIQPGCNTSKNSHNKHYGKMKNKQIKVKQK